MKKLLALLIAMCMVASLAACGGSGSSGGDATEAAAETEAAGGEEAEAPAEGEEAEAEAPAEGGDNTVVIAVISGFSAMDPAYVYETTPTLMVNACYETLYKFDTGVDTPQPCLVDSCEFSEDGKDVTMKLKPEVKFASGNDMTSADVAFSLMRLKNIKGNPSFLMDNVESVEVVDDDTFIIHQTTADSSLLAKLTYGSCSIVDSAIVKENGGTDAEDASTADTARDYLDTTSAGSGMYIMTSYVPDEEMILEKNYDYWGEQTNVDKYIIRFEGDANTQMMGLKAGDVDIALNLNDDTMDELEGAENVTTENTPTKTISFIMMNEDPEIGGPVSNKLVQQAIRLAVDYEGMQNVCGRGAITPKSIFQVGFLGSAGELDVATARDLDKAKALLAEAGYPDGFDIDLPVSDLDMEGIPMLDVAQKVKEDLSEIGINVNIVQQNWSGGYGDAYRAGDLGFSVMYWGIDYNDPNVQLAFLPGQSVGLRCRWQAEGYEPVIEKMNEIIQETDDTARGEKLLEIQDMIADDCPWIVVAQASSHIGYSNRLEGVAFTDVYRVDIRTINVK